MKMWLKLLYYDLKEMGIVFLVPIIVAFGLASYGIFIYCGAPIGQESSAAVTVMNLFQNLIFLSATYMLLPVWVLQVQP